MAHLPPKVPTMAANWPTFGQSPPATCQPNAPAQATQPSWVDEFLEFTASKRSVHRRSVSSGCGGGGVGHEFDRLDEEQLMSMFSDDVSPPPPEATTLPSATTMPNCSSIPSTPSENNSSFNDQEEKTSQSGGDGEQQPPSPAAQATAADPEMIVDPKRVKRILANRKSAQRSRVRKLQYISELERSVTSLQTEVAALSPRVAFLDHQRSLLTIGNSHLKQRIAALAQDKIFKDAHQEGLRKEIERLRQVYHQHNLKNMTSPILGTPAALTRS